MPDLLSNELNKNLSKKALKSNSRRSFLKNTGMSAMAIGSLGFMRPALALANNGNVITVTATLTLNPTNADAAIAALKELVAAVEATEPGVLAYICNRSLQDSNEIMFFEIYIDEDATKTHGKTAHMAKFAASYADFFVGEMKVAPYQQVVGYHR